VRNLLLFNLCLFVNFLVSFNISFERIFKLGLNVRELCLLLWARIQERQNGLIV
jgi:hypothetical protein